MDSAVQNAGTALSNPGASLAARFARKPVDHTVDKASKDFEGMFMAQMLQPMFETVGVDKIFGGGHGEEMMRGFLTQEYGKAMAKNSNFGIADAVKKELIMKQEKQHQQLQTASPAAISPSNNGAVNAVQSIQ